MGKPYQIGISPDKNYIFARSFRQPYTAGLAQTLAGDLAQFGENLDVLGCLIDIRGTTSVSSVVEKYEFAYKKATSAGLPRNWRFAFLVDHGDDSLNFIETVMNNAGFRFKIFEDEGEATNWLGVPRSS